MPTNIASMPRKQSSLIANIQGRRTGVVHHAWHADQHQKNGDKTKSLLDETGKAISDLMADADPRLETTAWIRLAGIAAVGLIDCILLGNVIEFIVGVDLQQMPWMRFAGPLAVLILDLALMDLSMRAADSVRDGLGSRWRSIGLNSFCFLFSLVMPLGALALFSVSQGELSKLTSGALFVAMFALSLTGHLLILFWRHDVVDSLTYGRLWTRRALQRQRIRSTERLASSKLGHVRTNFDEFAADLETYRTAYPGFPAPMPAFDLVTLRILEAIYGTGVVRASGETIGQSNVRPTNESNETPQAPTAQPSPAPAAPSDNGAAEEIDYLRTILAQRQRNDDSEVKP
jgi:hypothetical protein